MTLRAAIACIVLVGCGRLQFDARGDAMSDVPIDASVPDLGPTARYIDYVMAAGPRAYYRLGETTIDVVVDASGNDNHGTYWTNLGGMLTFDRPGALTDPHPAVKMDADGNLGPTDAAYAMVPTTLIDWSGDFTIELFLQPTSPPPVGFENALFVCEDYLNSGFRAGWSSSSVLHVWTTQAGATGQTTSSGRLVYGQFNHIVIVRNGTSLLGYLDGAQIFAEPNFDYIPPTAGSDCGFGSFHGMPSYGIFDEVAIYDRALSQTEVTAHLNAR